MVTGAYVNIQDFLSLGDENRMIEARVRQRRRNERQMEEREIAEKERRERMELKIQREAQRRQDERVPRNGTAAVTLGGVSRLSSNNRAQYGNQSLLIAPSRPAPRQSKRERDPPAPIVYNFKICPNFQATRAKFGHPKSVERWTIEHVREFVRWARYTCDVSVNIDKWAFDGKALSQLEKGDFLARVNSGESERFWQVHQHLVETGVVVFAEASKVESVEGGGALPSKRPVLGKNSRKN